MRCFSDFGKESRVPRQGSEGREGLLKKRILALVPWCVGKGKGSKVERMLEPNPRREVQGVLRVGVGRGGTNMAGGGRGRVKLGTC